MSWLSLAKYDLSRYLRVEPSGPGCDLIQVTRFERQKKSCCWNKNKFVVKMCELYGNSSKEFECVRV